MILNNSFENHFGICMKYWGNNDGEWEKKTWRKLNGKLKLLSIFWGRTKDVRVSFIAVKSLSVTIIILNDTFFPVLPATQIQFKYMKYNSTLAHDRVFDEIGPARYSLQI